MRAGHIVPEGHVPSLPARVSPDIDARTHPQPDAVVPVCYGPDLGP